MADEQVIQEVDTVAENTVADTPEALQAPVAAQEIVAEVAQATEAVEAPKPAPAAPQRQRPNYSRAPGSGGPGGGYSRDRRGGSRMSEEPKEFDERVVFVNRVARVVKGGRRFRFQALVILGDHKGRVGAGVAKGADVSVAVTKATDTAKKHLITLPIYKGTLAHEVEAKASGAKILILPAAPGTGLIAGGVVRTVLEVAGYENALSKSHGSSNRLNMAYATLTALQSLRPSDKWVTRENNKSSKPKPAAKADKPKVVKTIKKPVKKSKKAEAK